MNRNFAVPILIALLAVAAPAASRAQSGDGEAHQGMGAGGHMGMMRGMHGPGGMIEGLQLTDDQKAKLQDVHFRHMKKAISMRAELQLANVDLQRLMGAETPDQRAIDAQIDRIAGMRAGLHKAGVASMFEARAILTPEQRKLWREKHGSGGMMHGMRGRMMHGGMMRGGPHTGMNDENGMPQDQDSEGDSQ